MLNKLLDLSESQVSSSSKFNNWRGQFEWGYECICSLKGMWGWVARGKFVTTASDHLYGYCNYYKYMMIQIILPVS